MAIVALMSRALAGIARDRSGKLVKASEYYEHTSGSSYEVKISDLNGGQLIEPQKTAAQSSEDALRWYS